MVAVAEKESVDQALARLDVVPEPYRSAGIDVLLDRELITATGARLSAEQRGDLQPTAGPLAVLTDLCALD